VSCVGWLEKEESEEEGRREECSEGEKPINRRCKLPCLDFKKLSAALPAISAD
jgi:hypothetical protein